MGRTLPSLHGSGASSQALRGEAALVRVRGTCGMHATSNS